MNGNNETNRWRNNFRDRNSIRNINRKLGKRSNNKIFISNISYKCRWQDVKDFFNSNVGYVKSVELFVDENNRPNGCGTVEFADSELARRCIQTMQNLEFFGRRLIIKDDLGNDWKSRKNFCHVNEETSINDSNCENNISFVPNPVINTYGLSYQFLQNLNITLPINNKVSVSNLNYILDERKIKEVFKLCGRIIDIELRRDRFGKSEGIAIIDYEHPLEAIQAVSMLNNQIFYDRKMIVRMIKLDEEKLFLKLPEGLQGVGAGLGYNGQPLTNIALKFSQLFNYNPIYHSNSIINNDSYSLQTSNNSNYTDDAKILTPTKHFVKNKPLEINQQLPQVKQEPSEIKLQIKQELMDIKQEFDKSYDEDINVKLENNKELQNIYNESAINKYSKKK